MLLDNQYQSLKKRIVAATDDDVAIALFEEGEYDNAVEVLKGIAGLHADDGKLVNKLVEDVERATKGS